MRTKPTFSGLLVHFRQWTNKRYAVFNSLHRIIKICTLALTYSLVTIPRSGFAQEPDSAESETFMLEEVTIEASLLNLKSSELGRQITIISAQQLQNAPVSSLDELMRYLPGIETQSRGAFGTQSDFSLRGTNFNQMLVLIDGHKINDPNTGHFNSNIPLAVPEIERIEIIHGAASCEYGPDAMGGVINIVTRTFARKPLQPECIANGKFLYGKYNLFMASPGIYYTGKKISASGGILMNISDGNRLSSGLRNYFNNKTYSASVAFHPNSNTSVAYRFGSDLRDFNAQWYYSTSPADSACEKVVRNRHHLQLAHQHGIHKSVLTTSYLTTNDNFAFNSRFTAENSTAYFLTRLTHHIQYSKALATLAGLEFDRRSIESNNRGNHAINHGALFYLLTYRPLPKISFNPSIRIDFDERNKLFILPQASILYSESPKLRFRASAAKAIRIPDFTELYYNNYAENVSPGNRLGNPQLNPESSWNYEVGADIQILPSLNATATVFFRNTKDQIDYVRTNSSDITDLSNLKPNADYWRAFNNSKVAAKGIDTRFSYFLNIAQQFSTEISLGYLYTAIDYHSALQPLYLLMHAKHLVNGLLFIRAYNLSVSINSSYRVRERSFYNESINRYLKKSYAVWNTSLEYPFFRKNLYANIMIFNIFDMKYSDFLGAEMPGRWVAGGVKFSF